jgi:hypothetical protein
MPVIAHQKRSNIHWAGVVRMITSGMSQVAIARPKACGL